MKGLCPECNQEIEFDPRTLSQNSYFWMICHIGCDTAGYTKGEFGQEMCDLVFGEKGYTSNGVYKRLSYSTSSFTKVQFSKLIEATVQVCLEQGDRLPLL